MTHAEHVEKPPTAPITVSIEINGDDWGYVVRRLRELADQAEGRDTSNFQMFGGGAGGAYHVTTTRRDVSIEQYHAELQEWCNRRRS